MMGGMSVAEYEATPALVVDWDLELARLEAEIRSEDNK